MSSAANTPTSEEAPDAMMAEILEVFKEESAQQLQSIESALLALETDPQRGDLINSLFRDVHSIKGSAGIFSFDALEAFCHTVENFLEPLRTNLKHFNAEISSVLLLCTDHIRELVRIAIAGDARTQVHDPVGDGLLEQLSALNFEPTQAAKSIPAARLALPVKGAHVQEDVRGLRVSAVQLDHVINLVGELVTACAAAVQQLQMNDGANSARHADLLTPVQTLIDDLRSTTLQMRLIPLTETFGRFHRVVRDLAIELGKEVQLQIEGDDTTLDKAMVDRLTDPLMHLVRNALDHGLEPPSQRLANGKAAQAVLRLCARHEGPEVVITVQDDGRGVDVQAVRERGLQRGLVTAHQTLSPKDAIDLLFRPGFSTAPEVTSISGRGVGLDAVKSAIEGMRGKITMRSEFGQGATTEIRLPVTLSIIDGFLVQEGGCTYVLPAHTVQEVIAQAQPHTDAKDQHLVELRGALLPVVRLSEALGLCDQASPGRQSIVVVRSMENLFGVQVEKLLGQQQTVIKPMGVLLDKLSKRSGQASCVCGASILGNGDVALILEPQALWARLARDLTEIVH